MKAQAAATTKPTTSVTEMVDSGNLVIMHKTGGIIKRMSPSIERKIGDLKDEIKSDTKQQEAEWRKLRTPPKMGGSRNMDVDVATRITGGRHEAT